MTITRNATLWCNKCVYWIYAAELTTNGIEPRDDISIMNLAKEKGWTLCSKSIHICPTCTSTTNH